MPLRAFDVEKQENVFAHTSEKGRKYLCNWCLHHGIHSEMILKKGEIKIPHFAHKITISGCEYENESQEHMEVKLMLAEMFGGEVEYWIDGKEVDVYEPKKDICIEYEHSSLTYEKIWKKTNSINKPILWIFNKDKFYNPRTIGRGWFIKTNHTLNFVEKQMQCLCFYSNWEKRFYIIELGKPKYTHSKWGDGYCSTLFFFKLDILTRNEFVDFITTRWLNERF